MHPADPVMVLSSLPGHHCLLHHFAHLHPQILAAAAVVVAVAAAVAPEVDQATLAAAQHCPIHQEAVEAESQGNQEEAYHGEEAAYPAAFPGGNQGNSGVEEMEEQ